MDLDNMIDQFISILMNNQQPPVDLERALLDEGIDVAYIKEQYTY